MTDFANNKTQEPRSQHIPKVHMVCPDCGIEFVATNRDRQVIAPADFQSRYPDAQLKSFDDDFLVSWPCGLERGKDEECQHRQQQQLEIHGRIIGGSILHAALTGALPECKTPKSATEFVKMLTKNAKAIGNKWDKKNTNKQQENDLPF